MAGGGARAVATSARKNQNPGNGLGVEKSRIGTFMKMEVGTVKNRRSWMFQKLELGHGG